MQRRILVMVAGLVVMSLLLAACQSGSGGAAGPAVSSDSRPEAAPRAAAPAAGAGGGQAPQANLGNQQTADRMIVYTAQITLRVGSVGSGVEAVTAVAGRYGGFVAGSTRNDNEGSPTATVTLRIPAAQFQAAMADLRAGAERVLSESITSQDVTEEFADLEAQLRSFRATEAQYLELLRRANTVDEVLRVQQRLGEVRVQIERIEGRLRLLERRVDLSTITVTLTKRPALPGADPWDPGRIVSESWTASLRFLQAAATVGLRALVFFWWLIPLLVLGGLIVALLARMSNRGGRKGSVAG